MRLSRAVLLSSMMQAESWERTPPVHFFGLRLSQKLYRFLVTECEEGNLRFQVFCVHHVPVDEPLNDRNMVVSKSKEVVAEYPHVHEVFENMEKLIEFLDRYQIDVEEGWQPVEPA